MRRKAPLFVTFLSLVTLGCIGFCLASYDTGWFSQSGKGFRRRIGLLYACTSFLDSKSNTMLDICHLNSKSYVVEGAPFDPLTGTVLTVGIIMFIILIVAFIFTVISVPTSFAHCLVKSGKKAVALGKITAFCCFFSSTIITLGYFTFLIGVNASLAHDPHISFSWLVAVTAGVLSFINGVIITTQTKRDKSPIYVKNDFREAQEMRTVHVKPDVEWPPPEGVNPT